jgi:hypothetical protein
MSYKPGRHFVVCDICGFEFYDDEVRTTWDGKVVCKDDWEPRHPQDFVRAKPDKISAGYPRRPEAEDIYVSNTYTTQTAPPSGTFGNYLE